MRYYSEDELRAIGFKEIGQQVLISKTCSILTPRKIRLGNYVLIDDFTILDGTIMIGDHVHISSHCELLTGDQSTIIIGDCCAISSHTSLYALTDEYVGPYLPGPAIPRRYRWITQKDICLERFVIIGTHSVVLPGVCLGEGCSFGAMSMINESTPPGGMYVCAATHKLRKLCQRKIDKIRDKGQQLAEEDAHKRIRGNR